MELQSEILHTVAEDKSAINNELAVILFGKKKLSSSINKVEMSEEELNALLD